MNDNNELYRMIDFSDKKTLKQLLYFRADFESTSYGSRASPHDRDEPNNMLYTNIMDTYIDLDRLIERAKLTDKNRRLINLIMNGYTVSYIYNNFENYEETATIKMFNRILDKIVLEHQEQGGINNDY